MSEGGSPEDGELHLSVVDGCQGDIPCLEHQPSPSRVCKWDDRPILGF